MYPSAVEYELEGRLTKRSRAFQLQNMNIIGVGRGGGIDVMCPLGILTNQSQIITFLILKSDNIENSRIKLKGIVLPVPSNQIKVTFIIILPFNVTSTSGRHVPAGNLAPLAP